MTLKKNENINDDTMERAPIKIDIERMKKALEGPFYEIPSGLSREETREYILKIGRELNQQKTS